MKKILIVDDNEDVLTVLGKRLFNAGYQVIKAKNGQEGVAKAKTELPNLIILDIIMGDVYGSDVAQILKEDNNTKDIPVIFLTCLYTKKDEEAEGHLIKKNFFIAKPYDSAELLKIVQEKIR